MAQYLPILVLAVLAILFILVSLFVSKLVAPKRHTVEKLSPYECGIIPAREPAERFPVKFYLIAMLFIFFDIEIIFLYPWAVSHEALGVKGFIAILVFSLLVFESLVYLVAKGALDWGPLQIIEMQDDIVSPARTTESTVKRVGSKVREDEKK